MGDYFRRLRLACDTKSCKPPRIQNCAQWLLCRTKARLASPTFATKADGHPWSLNVFGGVTETTAFVFSSFTPFHFHSPTRICNSFFKFLSWSDHLANCIVSRTQDVYVHGYNHDRFPKLTKSVYNNTVKSHTSCPIPVARVLLYVAYGNGFYEAFRFITEELCKVCPPCAIYAKCDSNGWFTVTLGEGWCIPLSNHKLRQQ